MKPVTDEHVLTVGGDDNWPEGIGTVEWSSWILDRWWWWASCVSFGVGGPQLKYFFPGNLLITLSFSGGLLMSMNYHPTKNQISKMLSWGAVISEKLQFRLLHTSSRQKKKMVHPSSVVLLSDFAPSTSKTRYRALSTWSANHKLRLYHPQLDSNALRMSKNQLI